MRANERAHMTQRERMVAGVGGIGFAVLTFVGFGVASSPGGTYSASDVADYMAKGHHTAVFIALVLGVLSVLGLILLLVGLRERVTEGSFLATVFATTSLVSVTGFAVGWAAWLAAPLSHAYGGSSVAIDPKVAYVILQVGAVIFFGVGATFLGLSLITLMIGSAQTLPTWLRWFSLIVGVLGLASLAWIPFFPLLLWGLVIGIWLLASSRKTDTPAPQTT